MTLLEAQRRVTLTTTRKSPRPYPTLARSRPRIFANCGAALRFSVLINNTDDHLRNHGFPCAKPGGWRLSPAFDINPNPDPGVSRQTGIGGAYDWAGALDALMTYAKEFRLTPRAAGGDTG